MKKLTLTSFLIIITLGFSSCTQDDNTILEDASAENLLKSFNLNKDSNGEYSLDYELGKGADADNVLDTKTNTNNIYLYSSELGQSRKSNQELMIQDGQLKVNFEDTENDKKYTITILDDDIETNRNQDSEFLESYGISGNDDGSYDLDFRVKDGVAVDFIYNGDEDAYEVHLRNDSSASQSDFVQTYTKDDGRALKIDFVNHLGEGREMVTKKPRAAVED